MNAAAVPSLFFEQLSMLPIHSLFIHLSIANVYLNIQFFNEMFNFQLGIL